MFDLNFLKRAQFGQAKTQAGICCLAVLSLLCVQTGRSQSWRGPWAGTNSYAVSDLVSYNGSLYIDTVATAPGSASGAGTNLFDRHAVQTNAVIVAADGSTPWIGGPEATGYVDLGGASTYITNIVAGLFSPWGVAFYDTNKTYVSGFDVTNVPPQYRTAGNALAANQPISVPAGARYVRFWYSPSTDQGTTDAAAIINAGSTLQTAYTPYGGGGGTAATPSATPTDPTHWTLLTQPGPTGPAGPTGPVGAQGPAGPAGVSGGTGGSFLAGRRFGVLGDSISSYLFSNAWQNVVIARTGMSLVVQDARPGRALSTALECWGNPPLGGTPGAFHSQYAFGNAGGKCGDTILGITDGENFADSLANVDLQIIELGTNEEPNLGAPGDATTSGTFYGDLRWVVEAYLNAKPTLRIVLVTPEYNILEPGSTIQQYAQAMTIYGKSLGIPVINMFEHGAVNPITAGSLLRDGLHPNDFNFNNIYGPVIAQGLQHIY